jgi:hypothetical protein
MYGPRLCNEYIRGVDAFIDFMKKDILDNIRGNICCPCKHCKNKKRYCIDDVLRSHLIKHGFMEDYRCWNKHEEEGLNDDDMNKPDILGFIDDDIEFQVHNIEEMILNVKRHDDDDDLYSNGELAKYKKMIEDSKKPLYHGYVAQYTRLFVMVKLFQLKAIHRWSDCGFKELLTFLKDMLPQGNVVPETVYESKQVIYPLGLEVEKIHVCKNDCILYHGPKYKDLEKCPICGLDQFNHRKDGGDDENCNKNRRKCRAKKVFWYFPIIPHLMRCFANKESKLL